MAARIVLLLSLLLLLAAGAAVAEPVEAEGDLAAMIADLEPTDATAIELAAPATDRPAPCAPTATADTPIASPWLDQVFRPPRALVSRR